MPAGAWGEKAGWRFGPLGNEPHLSSWAPVHPGESHAGGYSYARTKPGHKAELGESWEW